MDGHRGTPYRTIEVTPASPHVGAEIGGIDLTRPLAGAQLAELRRAFTDRLVLFFRDQEIGFDDHARLAEYFGTIGRHVGVTTHSRPSEDARVRRFHFDAGSSRVSGDVWHTDQSCAPVPPLASILYNHTLPPDGGGDTLFASMYAAYDALSDRMKTYLEGLTALHDGVPVFGEGTPRATHPVVVAPPRERAQAALRQRGLHRAHRRGPAGREQTPARLPGRALHPARMDLPLPLDGRTRSRCGTTAAPSTARSPTTSPTPAPATAYRSTGPRRRWRGRGRPTTHLTTAIRRITQTHDPAFQEPGVEAVLRTRRREPHSRGSPGNRA